MCISDRAKGLVLIILFSFSFVGATPVSPIDLSKVPREHRFNMYIYDEMGTSNKGMMDAYKLSKTLKAGDYVLVHINSPGGEVYSTIDLINSMERSGATYIAINEGNVISAAAMLAVHCQYIFSLNNTIWLFHMSSITILGLHTYMPDWNSKDQEDVLKILEAAPLSDEEWYRMTRLKNNIIITGEEMNQRYGERAKVLGLKFKQEEGNYFPELMSIFITAN